MSAVLSLGSNVGDRLGHLRAGVELVRQVLAVSVVSPVYETDPVGVTGQQPYLNCVAVVDCDDAETVFGAARRAEDLRGRVRTSRWASRTLDVDVIAVDDVVQDDPRLTLPHPRAADRAFVLVPWCDVQPDAELPGRGSVRALVRRLDVSGVRRWSE
ncbi:MAG TPA: 2-amino-4-hydroxy-6-hydroxymethyldihydropteridine diphosphokinase [Mycobacteriales bacterium]|nr:2-amino-4-hydroxy-6-hydroxymethyldihydropteridine diphosphokinase [Mycobacteriales bacterium]